ncbi:MAG: 2Fe-2S iron-sulfur cluster-binding protein [bacterium]
MWTPRFWLAFFVNCRLGFCLRCNVRMNGRTVLACETIDEPDMILEPVHRGRVLRDLMCETT